MKTHSFFKPYARISLALISFCLLASCFFASAPIRAESEKKNEKRENLRIGYCQSEFYYEYQYQLYYLVKGMEEYGLIPPLPSDAPIQEETDSEELWQYLSGLDQTGWDVTFVPQAFISLDSSSYSLDKSRGSQEIDQLISDSQIDLMITMGTKAGLCIRDLPCQVPIMNFMSADPVDAGIVKQTDYSGIKHVWAQVDPDAFSRSISVMYDTFHPARLGIIYADNEEAYVYSGAKELDRFCSDKSVTVQKEFVEDAADKNDYQNYVSQMRQAAQNLASKIDVFIMTTTLLEPEDYPYALEPFFENGVSVYSINSAMDVKYGALMAAEAADYPNIGRFGADTLKQYINGSELEELNQLYQTAPFLVLNYGTAKKTGYRPTFDMLYSASKIYR